MWGQPANLCGYWWKMVWAILWLPLTWWSYFFKDNPDSHGQRIGNCLFFSFALFLIDFVGSIIARDAFNQGGVWAAIWGLPCGIILFLCFAAIVALLTYIGEHCNEWSFWKRKNKTKKTQKSDSLILSFIKAKKAKLCPAITWLDKDGNPIKNNY